MTKSNIHPITRNGQVSRTVHQQNPARIVFTGERTLTRVRVFFNGQPRWITYWDVAVLVTLVIAREENRDCGYVRLPGARPEKMVWQLRERIVKGLDFIESGGDSAYRLTFEIREGVIQMEKNFSELVGRKFRKLTIVTQEQFAKLCNICSSEPR